MVTKNEATAEDAAESIAEAESAIQFRSLSRSDILGVMAIVLVTSLCMLAAYHLIWGRNAAKNVFATIDMTALVSAKEEEFKQLLSKPNMTDKEREEAFVLVSQVGPQLERAIAIVQQECQCTILVKTSIVSGPVPDYTDQVKKLISAKN